MPALSQKSPAFIAATIAAEFGTWVASSVRAVSISFTVAPVNNFIPPSFKRICSTMTPASTPYSTMLSVLKYLLVPTQGSPTAVDPSRIIVEALPNLNS